MSATKFWEMIFNSSLPLNSIQSRLWKQPLKILFKIVAALKHATWQHLEFRYLNPLLCAPLEMCGSNLDCKFGSYIIGQLSLPPPTTTWNPLGWGNEVLKQEFPWSYLSFEFTLNWCISTTFCCPLNPSVLGKWQAQLFLQFSQTESNLIQNLSKFWIFPVLMVCDWDIPYAREWWMDYGSAGFL